jgi:hypothetical protein
MPSCSCDLSQLNLTGYSAVERIVIPDISPSPLFLQCPGCGARWHGFDDDHPLYEVATRYVSGPKSMRPITIREVIGIALVGASFSAAAPIVTGILRGLVYASFVLLLMVGLLVVLIVQTMETAIVGLL